MVVVSEVSGRAPLRWVAMAMVALCAAVLRTTPLAAGDRPTEDYKGFTLAELMEMDVVYGASAHEQKVSEAPSAVSVITADEIREFGYNTLAEVLSSARGIYATDDRNYSYLGVRGFNRPGDYSTRVLILVDGHRVNDAVVGQAPVGLEFPLDLAIIERVEVIRGPSSSLYGTSALFGVINIVTRTPQAAQGLSTTGLAESEECISGHFSYGRTSEAGLGWLVAGGALSKAGGDLYYPEFDHPSTDFGVFENGDWESVVRGYGKLIRGPLTLNGYLVRRDKGIPTASFGTVFNDDRAWSFDGRGALDARYEMPVGDRVSFIGRLSYDWFNYHGDYPYDVTQPGGPATSVISRDLQASQSVGAEARLVSEAWKAHRLIAGATLHSSLRTEQKAWDMDPYFLYLQDDRGSGQWGLYAQDEVAIAGPLRASLGLRYDHYRTFGGTLSPRLALIATVRPGTILKGLYGEGFRAPSPYELYYQDGVSQKENPDLDPERMASHELVLEHTLPRGIKGLLSLYRYRVEDLISQTTDPADGFALFVNGETIDSQGLEVEIDGRLAPRVRARMGYALQETRDRATNALLTNSPRHLAKLNLRFPLQQEGLTGAVELLYVSSRRTLQGNDVGAYALTNVTVTHSLPMRPILVSATMRNLFDVEYGDPGSEEHAQDVIPRPGRAFQVRLTYQR